MGTVRAAAGGAQYISPVAASVPCATSVNTAWSMPLPVQLITPPRYPLSGPALMETDMGPCWSMFSERGDLPKADEKPSERPQFRRVVSIMAAAGM